MANIEQLDLAITAHTKWKFRLQRALASGTFDDSVETVRMDNQCALGKWLHGPTLTPAERASQNFKTVVQRHVSFHDCAARVLALALSGNKKEAERIMAAGGGEFTTASSKLIFALMEWKKVSK